MRTDQLTATSRIDQLLFGIRKRDVSHDLDDNCVFYQARRSCPLSVDSDYTLDRKIEFQAETIGVFHNGIVFLQSLR